MVLEVLGRSGWQNLPSPPPPAPSQGQFRRWLILVLTLPSEMSGPSASLPSQNTLGGAASRSSHPEGGRGSEKRYELNGKTNIWSGWGGTIDSFLMISMSPALPASLGHWKPKSLLDQGWPGFDSVTSVPHKKFTCGLPARCSSTWVAAGTCWHEGYWVSQEEAGQQEMLRAVTLGQCRGVPHEYAASSYFSLTAMWLHHSFNL